MSAELEEEMEQSIGGMFEDFDAIAASVTPEQTSRALVAVSDCRRLDDEARGYWRDYPDMRTGDPVPPYMPPVIGGRDIDSWWMQLNRRVAAANPLSYQYSSAVEPEKEALAAVAAVAVAWIEALDRREEKRVRMSPPPVRWLYLFRRWLAGVIAP